MKRFGANRVMEPKGVTPVMAWKLDDDRKVRAGEIRVSLETVHIEWDNFNQICSYCSYDEVRIKARIMQIVQQRGKLHNPYTGSGGLFMGTIEEIGEGTDTGNLKAGDRVYSLSSLTGVVMHLDEIKSVDYHYGQIYCTGYVICFEATSIVKYEGKISPKYLLSAVDEEGNFIGFRKAIRNSHAERVAIIGGNFSTMLLYAQTLTDGYGKGTHVTAILDKNSTGLLSEKEITAAFLPVIKKTCYVDLSQPLDAYQSVVEQLYDPRPMDAVINLEDIPGSETVATLLVKENGVVFYASLKNNYGAGLLVADSLGKEVTSYALDGYVKEAHNFAAELIEKVGANLEFLDAIYQRKESSAAGRGGVAGRDGVMSKNGSGAQILRGNVQQVEDFVFRSPVTAAMIDEVLNVARYDCNVILQGETGVGKEKVFNILHQNSPRRGKPCIKINCATIQENLAESEFFGYEKGAFTGAQASGKAGYFEMANHGTLFLDEIGALSIGMQSKLLRVLQENTFYRVGGTEQKHVNVRVVCANNVPLRKLVDEGRFREDLYYRLNICAVDIPALRERKEDIECLAEAFLEGYGKKYGAEKEFSPEALEMLKSYDWPGNVRQLENAVHRLYIGQRGWIIDENQVEKFLCSAGWVQAAGAGGAPGGALAGGAVVPVAASDCGSPTAAPDCGGGAVVPVAAVGGSGSPATDELIVDLRKELRSDDGVDFNRIMEAQEKLLIEYALKKEGTTRKAAEYLNMSQATLARKKVRYGL